MLYPTELRARDEVLRLECSVLRIGAERNDSETRLSALRSQHFAAVLVGATGFEPATSCSQSRRATELRYAPTLK